MRNRRVLVVIAGVGALLTMLGVSVGRAGSTVVAAPNSMAAFGDSFSVGFAPDPSCPFSCPAVSWTTGTSVDSHYQRLLAVNPAISGQAHNGAGPGAMMTNFAGQVSSTITGGFTPGYVTVMLGLGDICFATTDASTFGNQFSAGINAIFAAAPSAKVLVSSLPNLESIRTAALQRDPNATWSLCGTFFTGTDAFRAAAMARAAAYDAELARQCANYTNCLYDGGAVAAHVWTLA